MHLHCKRYASTPSSHALPPPPSPPHPPAPVPTNPQLFLPAEGENANRPSQTLPLHLAPLPNNEPLPPPTHSSPPPPYYSPSTPTLAPRCVLPFQPSCLRSQQHPKRSFLSCLPSPFKHHTVPPPLALLLHHHLSPSLPLSPLPTRPSPLYLP
jgi:hypothetical protein